MSEGSESAGIEGLPLPDLIELLRLPAEDSRASTAATETLRRFQPLLRKYWAWHRLGEYEDFVQECMLRLFIALPKLRDAASFPGLFRRVVIGTAADVLRGQQGKKGIIEVELDEDQLATEFDESISTGVVVRSYLELLPDREREVVELTFLHEMTSAEAGARLGLTEGAVRTARSRAINRLRTILGRVTKKNPP